MSTRFRALQQQSQALLAAARSGGETETVSRLVEDREQLLRECIAELVSGEAVSRDAVRDLQELEREIAAAMLERRNQIYAELTALQRARCADLAYIPASAGAALYLDKEG